MEPCAAPTGANQAAICLTFAPEQMTFENDAAYDGSGVLAVHVFDVPNPPNGSAGDAIALYQEIFPANAMTGGEISLSALPSPSIALDSPPSTVYVRAI